MEIVCHDDISEGGIEGREQVGQKQTTKTQTKNL